MWELKVSQEMQPWAALVCFYFFSYPANVCGVYYAEWWLGFHNSHGQKVRSDQLSTEWPVRFLKGWWEGGGQLWLLVLSAELQQRLTGPASRGRSSCRWAQAILFPATAADFWMANGRGMLTSTGQTTCVPGWSLPIPGGCSWWVSVWETKIFKSWHSPGAIDTHAPPRNSLPSIFASFQAQTSGSQAFSQCPWVWIKSGHFPLYTQWMANYAPQGWWAESWPLKIFTSQSLEPLNMFMAKGTVQLS